MKNQVLDEQIDHFVEALFNDTEVGENELSEIADSPTIWWGVQRNIAKQKDAVKSPWPPSILRLALLCNAPAVIVVAMVVSFYVFRPFIDENAVAAVQVPLNIANIDQPAPSTLETAPTVSHVITSNRPSVRIAQRRAGRTEKTPAHYTTNGTTIAKTNASPVIKSDFIALSYANIAESGQIVRVKVPRSMMVSLGLITSVNKSSDLVDAEVIVGDDGLTRAIRFIR